MRQAPPPHNKKWWSPWRWRLADLKMLPKTELFYVIFALPGALLYIGYTVMDAFVFLNPASGLDPSVRTFARPLVSLLVRRVCCSLFYLGFSSSSSIDAQVYGLFTIHIILASTNVRLAASCATANDLVVVLILDWSVWAVRTATFWLATAPAASKAKYSSALKRFLIFQTWDKIKFILAGKGAEMHDYRCFEYMIECSALTICYICTLMGFLWFKALGLGPSDPAFAFWFPLGSTSLIYTLVGFGNDIVQDASAHALGRYAANRHPQSANYTAIYSVLARMDKGAERRSVQGRQGRWRDAMVCGSSHTVWLLSCPGGLSEAGG
jgi:hypothetical protein